MAENGCPPAKILIVDDDESIRGSLGEFLEDYDYEVVKAASAEQALARIRGAHFDIAVVDLRLPGMSGDVMIPEAHELDPEIRFIIHTGSMDYVLSEDLIRMGMRPEHVLLKPVTDLSILVGIIEDLTK